MANYKFIPLSPIDFLSYEGMEILLNSRNKETLLALDSNIEKYLFGNSEDIHYATSPN